MGISWRGDVGVTNSVTSRRDRDPGDRRGGKACSSCRGLNRRGVGEASSGGIGGTFGGGVGLSRCGDVGVTSCKSSSGGRDRRDRRTGKACSSRRGPGSGEVSNGGSRRGFGEASSGGVDEASGGDVRRGPEDGRIPDWCVPRVSRRLLVGHDEWLGHDEQGEVGVQ